MSAKKQTSITLGRVTIDTKADRSERYLDVAGKGFGRPEYKHLCQVVRAGHHDQQDAIKAIQAMALQSTAYLDWLLCLRDDVARMAPSDWRSLVELIGSGKMLAK